MFKKGVVSLYKDQKGQVLLIIVLVMVVALTVGLSVTSRTITNLRNTRDQANSQKALSAAEAGIEQAIKSGVSVADNNFSGNTTYSTTVTQVLGTSSFLLNGGNLIQKHDATYVWVTPYSTNPANLWQNPWSGNLSIYWGNSSGDCNNAAIEISVISGSTAVPVMTRFAYDPCQARRGGNNFSPPASSPITVSGKTLSYRVTRALTNALLVRVNPLYADSYIGAAGSTALPQQGITVTSIGTSDNDTKRKVTVFQGYPEVPAEFFPYILYQP